MFPLFLALTLISIIALVAGTVMLLTRRGNVTKESGPQVGAEIMGGGEDASDCGDITIGEASFFKGKAAAVSVSGELSLTEAKQAWKERRWNVVLLAVLLIFGFAGLFLFGALALFTGLESKLPGLIALGIAAWVIYIIARDCVRS